MVHEPAGFRDFVASRSRPLLRTAYLLTGDWMLAQDLVQTALAKTWTRWSRVERKESPELYVRRVMTTTYLTWRRRRWHGEVPTDVLPDRGSGIDDYAAVDLRQMLDGALAVLPRRQRAVIVLRYFDDLTEAQTAHVLGCSVGTVKSHTARALERLRSLPALGEPTGEELSR